MAKAKTDGILVTGAAAECPVDFSRGTSLCPMSFKPRKIKILIPLNMYGGHEHKDETCSGSA